MGSARLAVKGTTVTRVPSYDQNPRGFKFEHFTAFTSRVYAENELCDVIGTVISVTDAIPFNLYNKDQFRRTVILEDVAGVQLECCFFDEWCNKLNKLHDDRETIGHVVLILQSCKIKYFNGKPTAQPAMYSTKLYVNDDIPEIAVFKQRYAEKDGFDPSTHCISLFTPVKKELTADDFFKGAIKKNVGKIRDSDGPYHCIIYAKIHKIHRENGWTYLACKRCGRSAKEADSKNNKKIWNCKIHPGLTAPQVHMRFKVVVRVMDDTGSASLLLFDDLVFNLNDHVHCHRLLQEHGPNHEDYFPPELNVLVGKQVLWRFEYTQDHIEKNNHQYQIKLMTQDEAMIARFKQNFILEESNTGLVTPLVQILPVIPNGSRQDIVHASLNMSYLWKHCTVLKLTKNMRLRVGCNPEDAEEISDFADWILKIGEGNIGGKNDGHAPVEFPEEMLIPNSDDHIESLIKETYDDWQNNIGDPSYFQDRAILAPTHEQVDKVNERMLAKLPGREKVCYSSDSVSDVDIDFKFNESLYTTEFLNTIKMYGIPHHKLVLKAGAPVMCLRNIDQRGGLCNGTRLQVLRFSKNNIEAKIISGGKVGSVVAIPRMNVSPSDMKMPFQLNRRQYPVSLCFAMTINKSQGQTLSKVGLFLERPVFSHGQLYVAVSRVKSKKGLKVLCCDKDGNYSNHTTNVVFKEVLHRL